MPVKENTMNIDRNFLVSAIRACANEIYDKADTIIGNEKIFGRYEIIIALDDESVPSVSINRELKAFTFIPDLSDINKITN